MRFFHEKHTYALPGHVEVSVLERCPSYGMSVLRGFTVVIFYSSWIILRGSAIIIRHNLCISCYFFYLFKKSLTNWTEIFNEALP